SVVALSLAEASVKVRQGPPSDEPEDYALPIWAGVLPLRLSWGAPETDPAMTSEVETPAHVASRPAPGR
ncbi:pyridoxamine 5'-phosphate oxidase family protein, partial [Streptosporangium algeriense]